MIQHILVALDQSAYSERALAQAQDLAQATGARITLLSAVEPLGAEDTPELAKVLQIRRERVERYLATQEQATHTAGVAQVATVLRSGEPADAILDVARELGADLIAIATHGIGARGRHAIGSVAQAVLLLAPCPVLVVRIAEETPRPSSSR
jgi:nucleotide-binding universal stress UspA family protein